MIVAIFAVIGVIYSIGFVVPEYTAFTKLVLAGQSSDATGNTTEAITTTDLTINSKLVGTYSELVTSNDVVRQVITNTGMDISEEALKSSIEVSSVEDTDVIKISVTNQNPTYATKLANETAKAFMEKVAEIYNINNVHVVDEAEEPQSPSNVNHLKDVVIFTFIGVVIAVGYVLIANMLDNTIKTREEVERLYKVPVIAEIPLNLPEKGGKK